MNNSYLSRIFQMKSVNDFALGLVSVFIPIYLLDLGYSVQIVFSWMLVLFTSFTITIFISTYLTNKIGFVYTFYIRFIFLISHLGLLILLPKHPFLLFITAILTGIEWSLFWIPLNILFVRNTLENKTGMALSKLSVYSEVLSMFSPIIGAFIVTRFGFPVLFFTAMILALLATIPLFPLKSEKTDFKFTLIHAKKIYFKYKVFFKTEIIARLAEDTGAIWSIFVYLQLANKFNIGVISTVAGVAGLFFALTIGKLTDDWSKHSLLKIGAISVTFVWIISFVIGTSSTNPWLFYLATFIMGLALKTFIIPYRTMLWNSGRKDDAQFVVLREIPSFLGRVILFGLAIIFYDKLAILILIIGLIFLYFVLTDSRRLEVPN